MAKIFTRAGSYLTQASADRAQEIEDDRIRDAKIDRTISKIGQLGKAYQEYQGRKADRQIFGALIDSRSGASPSSPGVTTGFNTGGGARYLDPSQLQAQNQGRYGQQPQAGQRPQSGLLNRIGQSMNQGRALSSMEQLIAESELKQRYREPKKWEPRTREDALSFERAKKTATGWKPQTMEAALAYEKAKARLRGRSSNRSLRPFNELKEVLKLTPGWMASDEEKEDIKLMKDAARSELERYSTRDKNYFSEYTDAQEQDIQDNMDAYGKSREETIDALTRVGALN